MKILTRCLPLILGFAVCLMHKGTWAAEAAAQNNTETQKAQNLATLNQLETRVNKYPHDVQAKFKYATQLAYVGRDAEAVQALQALIQQYPEIPESYNNLAVLYARHGQHEEARATLEAALRANPSFAPAYQNLGSTYLQLAATAYARSIRLNPQDKFSKQRLQQIQAILAPSFATGTARSQAKESINGSTKQ